MKRCGHPTRAGHPCSLPLSQGLDRCTVHADDALTRMEITEALVLADRMLVAGHDTDAHRIIKAATGVDVTKIPMHPPERKPAKPTPWTREQMLLFSRSEGWPP